MLPSKRTSEPLSPGSGRSSTGRRALQVAPSSSDIAARRRGVPRLCSRKPAVLECGNLVFVGCEAVRPGVDELPKRPAVAVVVAVRRSGHNLAAGQDHKLLDQPARPYRAQAGEQAGGV
ncbi:hypothetical protein AHiyo4_02360 [Arthrobacter sp. Hiyo4]|nr:hypothetical protein AHiyo4_02360 [Arthrobacter sp. Hiyo4]